MRSLTYLAKFEKGTDGGYGISFPDLPGCCSYGDSFPEAVTMAKEALELHIYGLEKDGETVPVPQEFQAENFEGCIPVAVTVYPDLVRIDMDNKKVKVTTTLPRWLKTIAEKQHVNYSGILEAGVMEYLNLTPQAK